MPRSRPDDEPDDFFERLRRGDREAWEKAFRCYGPRVLAWIRAVIRSRNWYPLKGEEEDLLLATFVRAFERRSGLRCEDGVSLLAYLVRVASNLCIDEMRKKRPSRLPGGYTPGKDDERFWAMLTALLCQAIAELEPELRQVIRDVLEGYTWKETCARLQISKNEYFRRKYKAFKILRKRLRESGVGGQEFPCDERPPEEEGPRP